MPQHIHVLDNNVKARLQAQPYLLSLTSAIKELYQNSIDAGATEINIVYDPIQGDILCKDNGMGIRHEDMKKLGVVNHMTSKINSMDDLIGLKTYGFKGIALFSMGQLAQNIFMISKCPGYNSTWMVTLSNNCKILSEDWLPLQDLNEVFTLKPWALTEQGTVILIHDLLYHVPVRREMMMNEPLFKQFHQLKSDIFQLVIKHPKINITIDYLSKGKLKNIITFQPLTTIDLQDPTFYVRLVRNVFNPIIPNNVMKRVAIQFKQFKLKGIMSIFPLKSKDLQFIFINGWKYQNPTFIKLINSCFLSTSWPNNTTYQTMGKTVRWYPFFVFDIQSPPQTIDEMLQDPEKIIIRPHLENLLQNLILKVVKSFLKLQGYNVSDTVATTIPSNTPTELKSIPTSPRRISISPDLKELKLKKAKYVPSNNDSLIISQRVNEMINKKKNYPFIMSSTSPIKLGNNCWLDVKRINEDELNKLNYTITKAHLINGEIVSQIDKKFILMKFDENDSSTLLILDQHACDERVKLEAYLQNYINAIINKTLLLKQVTKSGEIQLNELEFELFTHYKDEFNVWGIEYLLNINNNSVKITTLSEILFEKCHGNNTLLREIMIQHIEDLKTYKKISIKKRFNLVSKPQSWHKFINNIPAFLMDFFNSKACRSAIMFGDILTTLECELLIHDLAKCFLPFQCAHGRPSIIPLTVISQSQSNDTPRDYLLD